MNIKITLDEVKAAARHAYEQGRLTAQNGGDCQYSQYINGKECVCAVGAAFTTEERRDLRIYGGNIRSISNLFYSERVQIPGADLDRIVEIQKAHDQWADTVRGTIDSITVDAAERHFLREIR